MKPLVFVSSTIEDLKHIRETVRDVVAEIGFQPVMSEYSEIGYMSGGSAVSSCCRGVSDCQIMILIIGNHYGSVDADGVSVTEKEFVSFQQKGGGRLITLVSADVMRYKTMYEANSMVSGLVVPGMSEPDKIFAFIDKVSRADQSNGIICYERASDIRVILKNQIADLVYRALVGENEAARGVMKDILSEVRTVRNAMGSGGKPSDFFLRATRFLLEEKNGDISKLLKKLSRVDKLIVSMERPENNTFSKLCEAHGVEIEKISAAVLSTQTAFEKYNLVEVNWFSPIHNKIPLTPEERLENMGYGWVVGRKKLLMTDATLRYYEAVYAEAIESIRDGL